MSHTEHTEHTARDEEPTDHRAQPEEGDLAANSPLMELIDLLAQMAAARIAGNASPK